MLVEGQWFNETGSLSDCGVAEWSRVAVSDSEGLAPC